MFIMCCGFKKKKDMQVDNQSTSKLYSMHNTGVLIKRNFFMASRRQYFNE